jgi:hypothetical protein
LTDIIAETKPEVMAIEKLFFAQNVTTAISVSHARGVAMLTGRQANLRIEEYTPLQIKQTMTGYGRATKKQVQEMVRMQLGLKEVPKPDDCADALAAAIMCAFMVKSKQPARLGRYANLAGKKPASKPRATRSTHKHRHFKWFWRMSRRKKILVLATPILLFLILTPLITYLIFANDIRDQERLMNRNNTGIVLTDRNGKALYSVGRAEHRTVVKLADISEEMQHALLASEDADFYKHGGFNILSIVRAAVTGVGGGSTLTQQLAKNTVLTDEHSFLRKYQELAVAIAIEQNYSKDQILEMYLNSVYYGENAFGIEEAARVYFGVTPKELNLAQHGDDGLYR